MKVLFITALAFLSCMPGAKGQSRDREFNLHKSGLLYSEADMKILRHMVDSLNLRFKTCDLSRPYYSFPQTPVFFVHFKSEKNSLEGITKDITPQTSFNELIKKHRAFIDEVDTTMLIIKTGKFGGKHSYLEGNPAYGYDYGFYDYEAGKAHIAGKWRYSYSPKDELTEYNSLLCWYFPLDLVQKKLPLKYAALIQYVDCMVDTSATVMLARPWPQEMNGVPASYLKMVDYINEKKADVTDTGRYRALFRLDQARFEYALVNLRDDPKFLELVNLAIEDCIRSKQGTGEFETLVATLVSKQKALELKRNRIVEGRCSQDPGPRYHALDIALLAAETHSWDIFLRSHLDIMNDNFSRISDGSYAQKRRETYLRELEALNLNVIDLLLGLTLRADNTASNHYHGSVSRLGRALAESKDRKAFEARTLEILKDPGLDEFNRGLIYILYSSYIQHLDDKKEAKELVRQLKRDATSFPVSLHSAIRELGLPK